MERELKQRAKRKAKPRENCTEITKYEYTNVRKVKGPTAPEGHP